MTDTGVNICIPEADLRNLDELLEAIITCEVPYEPDQLTMANRALAKTGRLAAQAEKVLRKYLQLRVEVK